MEPSQRRDALQGITDYRFYCFNGKPLVVYQYLNQLQPDGTKPTSTYCNAYNEKWERLPFHQHFGTSPENYTKPQEFEEMHSLARELSREMLFVRVDFYVIDGAVYFAELTFFPGSGLSGFHPESWDINLGQYLKLPCD